MRRELFARGVIDPQLFEAEVREKAIRSQELEGVRRPLEEEPVDIWEERLHRVRDHLTDFYFAYNLPFDLFENLVRESLEERGAPLDNPMIFFNPELAPHHMLFEQAIEIEKIPEGERSPYEARLREIKVVLIRTLISDQLSYVKIAKEWFTISDLINIRNRKIGQGKIGGKAAGMLLAARIINQVGDEELKVSVVIPESYFIGADMAYTFMASNDLIKWNDQKYKTETLIRSEFPTLQEEFLKGRFPPDVVEQFWGLLQFVHNKPLIVRSSSLLEDNFGTSFAGKYDSYFCPNQGSEEENLASFSEAIKRIYSSMFNPDALLYRKSKGLLDYDERMAILIQAVQGEAFGRYFLPHAAGVAFSRNLYRWSPQIRPEDGFARLVWGLGTRAVDRVGNDYPRLVALSHPLLHPEANPKDIRRYSQCYVDLIDLHDNEFKTLPIQEVLSPRYPPLRYLAQVDEDGYLYSLRSSVIDASVDRLVLTMDELLRRTPASRRLSGMLKVLEKHYESPVDTEFTLQIHEPFSAQPEIKISLLQCRPQSHVKEAEARLPRELNDRDVIFSTRRMAPPGRVSEITHVLFVVPESYFALPGNIARSALSQAIGKINAALANTTFICVGPGRWGTSTPDLGVPVGYGDIYNTRALVELTGRGIGAAPEASFGTHFFQDLVEANIYPIAVYLDDPGVIFRREFFYDTPDLLQDLFPGEKDLPECLRLIRVDTYRAGCYMELVMDDQQGRVVAFLESDEL